MLRFFRHLLGLETTASGDAGERIAADWLRRERGFEIVARNWRSPRDRREELDLVARDREALVFIEVKTRAADALVPGYHAVNGRKKRVVRRAAQAYLAGLREKPRTFRFDIVEVETTTATATVANGGGAAPIVRHFENVPLFTKHFRW